MANFIEKINISNFKSIKSCEINDCKRINLFIGKPNVGKSNILEALSLFSIPFLKEDGSPKLTNLIRLQNSPELFHLGNIEQGALIETSIGWCKLNYDPKEGLLVSIEFSGKFINNFYGIKVDEKLRIKGISNPNGFISPIKKYSFKPDVIYKKGHAKYLIPPFGSNLYTILNTYVDFRSQVLALFDEYKITLAFDTASQTVKPYWRDGDDIFLLPYSSIADTLQRIIFFKAAIASNDDSILLFEEPEAHSFPPYMTHLTQEMIHKKDNQFFIATHSPFILNDLLENAREELAVFVVRYEDHETKTRQLTQQELHDVFQYGVDLFTNNESFL